MGSNRVKRVLASIIASMAVLIGIGPGHSLLMSQFGGHGSHASSTASHCQLVCAPISLDGTAQRENVKDPEEPNPYFYQGYNVPINIEALIVVAMLAIAMAFLRARPPDLLTQYSLLRI